MILILSILILLLVVGFVAFVIYHFIRVDKVKKSCNDACPNVVGLVYSPKNEDMKDVMQAIQKFIVETQLWGCSSLRKNLSDHKDMVLEELTSVKFSCEDAIKEVDKQLESFKEEVTLNSNIDITPFLTSLRTLWILLLRKSCKDTKFDANKAKELANNLFDTVCYMPQR